MKNIFSASLGFAMRLTAILIFIVISGLSAGSLFAQAPASQGGESWSQMWNQSNVYYNLNALPLGSQLDTVAHSNSINLVACKVLSGVVNADTFVASPVPGYGKLSVFVNALKGASGGTDTITFRLIASNDGIVWDTVAGQKATLYPLSLASPVGAVFIVDKMSRYFGVSAAASVGSGNVAAWSSYYFNKAAYITSSH